MGASRTVDRKLAWPIREWGTPHAGGFKPGGHMEGEDVDEAKGHRQEGPEGIEDGGVVEDFFFC